MSGNDSINQTTPTFGFNQNIPMSGGGSTSGNDNMKDTLAALTQQMAQMQMTMTAQLQALGTRMQNRNDGRRELNYDDLNEDTPHQHNNMDFRHQEHREMDQFKNIKTTIPKFYGNFDPDTYLSWELDMTSVFNTHHQLTEDSKVRVATMAFKEHAARWWASECEERRE